MKSDDQLTFDERLCRAVAKGVADIDAGRYVTSIDEAFANAAKRRTSQGTLQAEDSPSHPCAVL